MCIRDRDPEKPPFCIVMPPPNVTGQLHMGHALDNTMPVSYTHLDVYKRQALITAIGIMEVLYFAKGAVNRDVDATAYLVAAVFYLLMTYGLTKLFQYLEKKFSF